MSPRRYKLFSVPRSQTAQRTLTVILVEVGRLGSLFAGECTDVSGTDQLRDVFGVRQRWVKVASGSLNRKGRK